MSPDEKSVTVLLSSGYRIPIVGLGMWQTDEPETVRTTLESAFKSGYRHIDTAFCYGNENLVGATLQEIFKSGLVTREELFIVTKLPCNGLRPDAVGHFLRKSLKNLQLDYIDLYLVHFPVATKWTDDDETFPVENDELLVEHVDLSETWQAMESFVDEGLIKSIGISNFNSVQIERIYKEARIKPACLQVECHAYLPQYELVEHCKRLNIAVIAYAPLGTPGLKAFAKKNYGVDIELDVLLKDPRLEPLSEKYQKTSAQILLRYLVQRGIIIIPKSSNPDRIKENIELFDFSIDPKDMSTLKSMAKNYRYFMFNHHKNMVEHPEYPFNIPF